MTPAILFFKKKKAGSAYCFMKITWQSFAGFFYCAHHIGFWIAHQLVKRTRTERFLHLHPSPFPREILSCVFNAELWVEGWLTAHCVSTFSFQWLWMLISESSCCLWWVHAAAEGCCCRGPASRALMAWTHGSWQLHCPQEWRCCPIGLVYK